MIPFTNLDKISFKVRTDSQLGSSDRLKIKLINKDGSYRSVQLVYSDPMKFLIGSCTNMTPFPRAITLLHINVWSFIRTSDGMKYTLNGETALDFRLSSEVCVSEVAGDNWEEKWRKEIVQIYFPSNDKASDFYGSTIGE